MRVSSLDSKVVRHKRYYNGNPLAYFRENFGLYTGMNRTQLSRFDSGLYRSLAREGQLEEAIPEANELAVELGRKLGKGELGLAKKEIMIIINAYKIHEGNALEASKQLPYSTTTIWKYWSANGLEARGNKLSESNIKKILKAYRKYEGNALEASKYLSYGLSTIIKYWRANRLKIQKKGWQKKH